MDEIDSIGSSRVEGSRGGDSEVQRTMLELLNQLDGFEPTQNIKVRAVVCVRATPAADARARGVFCSLCPVRCPSDKMNVLLY